MEKISNIWDIRKSTGRHITSVVRQISIKTILFPSTTHESKLQRDKIVSKWFIPVPKQSSKSFKGIKRKSRTQHGKSHNGSVQFSCSVMSSSLWPHGLQHSRFPCLSPTPRACSNSCPLSRWCHTTISSSAVPFSFCLQSFPASVSFAMSQFFTSGSQSTGASASPSVFPMNIQDWFPLRLTGLISLLSKGLSRVSFNHRSKASILWHSAWPDGQSVWWTMDGGSWQCTGDRKQDHPQEKEMQKGKIAVWGGLTNSCENKGSKKQRKKKDRYTHLNAEFQRIARRDKKAFLSDQCKEVEEKNSMGKTRDLFKKIRDT